MLTMKNALCLLFSLGYGFGMNIPETTILPKQPREEATTLPKDPRGGCGYGGYAGCGGYGVVPDAVNQGDIVVARCLFPDNIMDMEPEAVARCLFPNDIDLGDIVEPMEPAARGGVPWAPYAINLGDIVESLEPAAVRTDLIHKSSSAMNCGETVDLETVDFAVFQTKNFGVGYYPPDQSCTWTLEAPAGATVELYFLMFDLAYGDWLIVRGKDYYWGTSWQPIALPIQLGPDENSISFKFSSNNDRSRGRGFMLVNQITSFL